MTLHRDHRVELFDHQPRGPFLTRREAKLAVFDYLETFYNPRRRHFALGQVSPARFEQEHTARQAAA
jgi:transposase InsO family protein